MSVPSVLHSWVPRPLQLAHLVSRHGQHIVFNYVLMSIDGAIAYGVGHLNGTAGLEGFRWLFVSRS